MIAIYRFTLSASFLLAVASTSFAVTLPGNNFDGQMSLIYNDVNGGVFIENSPHPNPSVQHITITSPNSFLIPGALAVPPANIVTATPNVIELSAPGNFLGTSSFLGAILASSYSEPALLGELTISYNQFSSATQPGDLIHGSFGQLQAQPIVPTIGPAGNCCRFFNVATGNFYDPPLTAAYHYEMDSLSTFTKVGMPLGLGNPFTVTSSQGTVSVPEGGQHVFAGLGVAGFTISGITPPVDVQDPAAFPVYLEFSTPLASFSMTAVPEPSTLALVGLALCGLCGRFARRR